MKIFRIKIFLILIITFCVAIITSISSINANEGRSKNSVKYYRELAYSLVEDKKYDEAIEIYKKLIQLEANNFSYHFSLGTLYLRKEMYNDAIEECQRALEVDPNYPIAFAAHSHLAKAYAAKKEYNKAIEEFKKAEESFNDPIPPPRSAQIAIYKEWLDVSKQIGDLAKVEEITQKIKKLKEEIKSPPKEKIIKERRALAKEIFPSILVKNILGIFIPIIIILILIFLVYIMQRKRRKANRVS